jgi:ubiquinone/menaquinone biosynthesis C-methylase UbiE
MNQFATYEDENIHYWTNRSSGYSSVNQEELASQQKNVWGRQISGRIAARFPGRKPETIRVLDVGTGPGFFAIILAQMGYQVTAVDYTASMLEEARHNAGAFVGRIQFRQMNAEALCFASDSFDVVVTRNVTWNLHNPEQAYAHWTRVLAPGGLLLNFDANWYRYLWDEEAKQGHAQDRENLAASDVRDENAGTDVDAMEAIARQTPLSRQHRPAWDLDVLRRLGIQASADEEIWREVWTKEERINNASTPMFLVEGRKRSCGKRNEVSI